MKPNVKNYYKGTRQAYPTMPASEVLERIRKYIGTPAEDLKKAAPIHPYYGPRGAWNPEFDSFGSKHLRCVDHYARAGLRHVADAHEIDRNLAQGWYIDFRCDYETVTAAVFQIPGRDNRAYYFAGHWDPWNEHMAVIDCDPHIGEIRGTGYSPVHGYEQAAIDAARSADSFAQAFAEEQREYDLKSNAECRIDELHSQVRGSIDEFHGLKVDIQANKLPTNVCQRIRTDMQQIRHSVRKDIKEIIEIKDNPYTLLT